MSVHLFEPLVIRDVTLRNRIAVSPMCQYSSENGFANDWHLVHLGRFATGGAGLVFSEAAGVEARGRISPQDLGIYDDAHVEKLAQITRFIDGQGAVAGIQLAHAGRKASTARPWDGGGPVGPEAGGWSPVVGPSPIPFTEGWQTPAELTESQIGEVVRAFGEAARRSLEAGFRVVEIHGAHGYLLHSFYSPLSNRREDRYGGSFENRTRIVREVVEEVRRRWPERLPVFLRISSTDWTDWTEGGWDVEQSVELARMVKPLGVDLIDCSSGGNVAAAAIPAGPGYQTTFAAEIRRAAEVPTGAVGMILTPEQADHIVRSGQADLVLLARQMLRDPNFAIRAGFALHKKPWVPPQYLRAWPG